MMVARSRAAVVVASFLVSCAHSRPGGGGSAGVLSKPTQTPAARSPAPAPTDGDPVPPPPKVAQVERATERGAAGAVAIDGVAALLAGLPALITMRVTELDGGTMALDGLICPHQLVISAELADPAQSVTCTLDGDIGRCVPFVGLGDREIVRAFCGPPDSTSAAVVASPSSVPPPAWVPAFHRLFVPGGLGEIVPFDEGAALRIDLDDVDGPAYETRFVAVRTAGGWRVAAELVGECENPDRGQWRTLDATALVGAPAHAIITSCYSGGSQSGRLATWLRIVGDGPATRLPTIATKRIGDFTWAVSPAERRRWPRRAMFDLRARDHVEVLLEPTFLAGGRMLLRPVRTALRRLSTFCEPHERRCDHAGNDSICPLPELSDVQRSAGEWALRDGALVPLVARPHVRPQTRACRDLAADEE